MNDKSFGRVGFGVPCYNPEPEFWLWWTQLVIDGLETGDVFLNDGNVPLQVPIPVAHNAIVREFLRTDCDTLLLIEDDHSADPELVRNMRNSATNQEFDIVCASYIGRRGQPKPIGWFFHEHTPTGWRLRYNNGDVQSSGTQEYDGAGLGCVLIRRRVLVDMLGDNDPDTFFWFMWVNNNSQDVYFYELARNVGARVGVDRDNWATHWGKYPWRREDYERWRAAGERTKSVA